MFEPDNLAVIPDDVLPSESAFEAPSATESSHSLKPPGPGLWEALAWCLGMQVAHLIGGVLTIIAIAVSLLVGRGAQVAEQVEIKTMLDDIPKSYIFPLISGEMLIFVAITVVACCWRIGRPFTRKIGGTPIPARQLVLMLAGVVPMLLFCGGLHQVSSEVWKGIAELVPSLQFFDGLDTNENLKSFSKGVPFWALLLVMAVAPAMGEELIFRGVISRGLIARYGLGIGVAITSVLFAAVHIHPAHALAVLPLGAYIHVCYLASRSFAAPVLVHFLNNAVAVAIVSLTPKLLGGELELGEMPGEKQFPFLPMLIGGTIAALMLTAIWKSRVRYIVPGRGEWNPGYESVEVPPEHVGAIAVCDRCHPALYHPTLFLGMFATSFFAFGICKALGM